MNCSIRHLAKLRESKTPLRIVKARGEKKEGGESEATGGKLTSREQIASSMPATTCLFKLDTIGLLKCYF